MSPDDPRHGQRRGYYAHRRDGETACDACLRAAAAAQQKYELAWMHGKAGRVPAVGTKRRLRALQAIGWTLTAIADEIGSQRSRVEKWASEDRTYVYTTTAARVAEVYERLCMRSPEGPWATRTRNMAAAKGYAPPLAWDDIDHDEAPSLGGSDDELDEVAVLRLLEGDRVASTRAEKVEALRRWRATGRSEKSLCDTHGWKYGRYITREDEVA